MGDDGQGCGDSQRNRSGERGGDGDAVHEVVKGVADQNHFPRTGVDVTGPFVAVTPKGEPLEQEEQNDADQNRLQYRFARQPSQRMRDHAEKRRPEEGADRVRDQSGRKESKPLPLKEQEQSGKSDGTHRPEKAKRYDQSQIHAVSSNGFSSPAMM